MQLTIEIPDNIQPPKFRLFQEVYLAPCRTASKSDIRLKDAPPPRSGVIVGMNYVPLFQALVERYSGFGWEYQVDFYFGAPFEKALECVEPVQTYDESDLAAMDDIRSNAA